LEPSQAAALCLRNWKDGRASRAYIFLFAGPGADDGGAGAISENKTNCGDEELELHRNTLRYEL